MGHDAARMALRPLSPRHGVLAGYATTDAPGMGGLVRLVLVTGRAGPAGASPAAPAP